MSLYTRHSTLDELDLRTPTLDSPWSGEWCPYAFCLFLQSLGSDIVDRSTYQTAEGALNGDAGQKFSAWWQTLFTEGYAH